MPVRVIKNNSKKVQEKVEKIGIKIKDPEGREGTFLPTFRIQNDKGELALALKLKEDVEPVLFVYYVLDEEFVKRRNLLEDFRKMAKENNWKMIDARDLLDYALDEL